jgi:hypothetical protein
LELGDYDTKGGQVINEIRYEAKISEVNFSFPTVFLAGCTVRGNQPHLKSWRPEAIELFEKHGFSGNIIIPEFSVSTISDKYRYDLPVWEFEGLRKSHVIMFWIPRSRELIGLTTNFELGYWIARDRSKVIYGRPDDAYRIVYSDIMWVEDGKNRSDYCSYDSFPIYNTLEKTVVASLEKLSVMVVKEAK